MAAAVVVRGLVKRVGARLALDRVSFDIDRGELVAVVGPSGAGKSTLVDCLAGLRRPERGRIAVMGHDPQGDRARLRREVGVHRQHTALPARIRVDEAVATFAELGGAPADSEPILDRFGLTGIRAARFASLDEVERQRLYMALALLHGPDLVLLDGVTAERSAEARAEAWRWIDDARGTGATVLIVTPMVDEASRCDRILVFNEGVLVECDSPPALVRRHGGGVSFEFAHPGIGTNWILRIPGVAMLEDDGTRVRVWGTPDCLPRVKAALAGRSVIPSDLVAAQGELEEAMRHLTGSALAA